MHRNAIEGPPCSERARSPPRPGLVHLTNLMRKKQRASPRIQDLFKYHQVFFDQIFVVDYLSQNDK